VKPVHEPSATRLEADGSDNSAAPAGGPDDSQSTLEHLRITREKLAAQNDELRATRDLIERERQRYHDLFDLAPVGYLVTDLNGVVRESNRMAGELLARDRHVLAGKPLTALVGPERRSAFRVLIREAARGGRWHDEVPFLHSDGGRVRLLVSAHGPAAGTDEGIRWSLADVPPPSELRDPDTRELAAAQVLQRQRLSNLLDRLHRGVVTVSPSLRVTYANTAAAALLTGGRSPVGRTLVDPWPEPSLSKLAARMFEPGAVPEEASVNLKDEGRDLEVLALPQEASGDALLAIGDVTVQERQHRAEREFVANAAHQLRTPVSAIASAIEVLQGGAKEDPETRDRFLAHLDRQCNRLVRLTRALLVLARAQALAEPPAVEVVPVHPLLVSISRGLRPGEDVRVRVECPFDLAALSNRDLLEQAVENLAHNAAKYTHAGEIVLCADRIRGPKVRIAVSDSGPGARLAEGGFRRFYRGPGAEGEGFGLGLAIAEETMRVLGGELQIESDEGGTRAAVTLPAATVRHR
jgi:two-component system, OmpR family, phosphate regulon sensor histidine kinase PhoR